MKRSSLALVVSALSLSALSASAAAAARAPKAATRAADPAAPAAAPARVQAGSIRSTRRLPSAWTARARAAAQAHTPTYAAKMVRGTTGTGARYSMIVTPISQVGPDESAFLRMAEVKVSYRGSYFGDAPVGTSAVARVMVAGDGLGVGKQAVKDVVLTRQRDGSWKGKGTFEYAQSEEVSAVDTQVAFQGPVGVKSGNPNEHWDSDHGKDYAGPRITF